MKVNDYVRTDKGTIFKIENITEIDIDGQWFKSKVKENSVIKDLPRFMYDENDEYIIKSSPNIIDLIEEYDLVKIEYYAPRYEERLTRLFVVEYKDKDWIRFKNSHCELNIFHHQWGGNDKDLKPIIKSILTKEQFERCEYRIGE